MLWYTTPLWSMETLIEGGSAREFSGDMTPRLMVVLGREPGKLIPIGLGRQRLGRDADSEIHLFDPSISRHHANLTRSEEGTVTVEDVSSTNGTYINDNKIVNAALQNGDILRVGNVLLKYFEPGTMEAEVFQRVYHMALNDSLTETLTKSAIVYHLETMIQNEPEHLSIILLDLDHFKNVNDTYGHITGDVVLNRVAHILNHSALRKGDLLGRFGGEEFLIVLPNTSLDEAAHVADVLRVAIESTPIVVEGLNAPIHVTSSFGVAQWDPSDAADSQPPRPFLERADKALYQAKNEGRNAVRVFRNARPQGDHTLDDTA